MDRPLEVVACLILGLIALACVGGLIASFLVDKSPDPQVFSTFGITLGACVGAVAGIVSQRAKGNE